MTRIREGGASKENELVPEAMSDSTPSKRNATLLLYTNPRFLPPAPGEIRAFMQLFDTTAKHRACYYWHRPDIRLNRGLCVLAEQMKMLKR